MYQKKLLARAVAVCVTMSCLIVTGNSVAEGNNFVRDGAESKRGSMYLAVIQGTSDPRVKGWAKRVGSIVQQNAGTPLNSDSFESVLLIPLPSTNLGITNAANARAAEISLVLSHNEMPYAECNFDFESMQISRVPSAKYRVAVKKIGGYRPRSVGFCDVNLTKSGVQPGVPNVQAGDEISAVMASTSFAHGVFTNGQPDPRL